MNNELFVLALAVAAALYLAWGFKTLPRERWQILASLPLEKMTDGRWRGLNITYYGVLTATAQTAASALLVVMLGSLGVTPLGTLAVALPLMSVCVPASRWVAKVVENKPYTFTVAGAFFVGILLAPWLTVLAREALGRVYGQSLPVLPALTAFAVVFSLGEGLGRLACISFGCCYGKPLSACPESVRKLVGSAALVFSGATKKVSYEGHLEGARLVPIQAITAVINVSAALAGLWLFLAGHFYASLALVMIVSQGWRAASEFLRADHRGGGRLTAYQWMALIAIVYCLTVGALFDAPQASPSAAAGLDQLWHPALLLVLQALWVVTVLFTGRSKTTASHLDFYVVQENI